MRVSLRDGGKRCDCSLRGRRYIWGKDIFLVHLAEALRQDEQQTKGYLGPL